MNQPFSDNDFFDNLFSTVRKIWVESKKFFTAICWYFVLRPGSVDLHSSADPDPGSHNVADHPDPKQCLQQFNDPDKMKSINKINSELMNP